MRPLLSLGGACADRPAPPEPVSTPVTVPTLYHIRYSDGLAVQLNDQEVMDLVLILEVGEAIETGTEMAPTVANELTDWALLLLDRHAGDR